MASSQDSTDSERKARKTALVFGDLHFPFVNHRALELALHIGEKAKPDYIFLNGDICDCWQISRFDKNPALEPQANLRSEITETRAFLVALRARFKKAQIVYIFGNHEFRWDKYIRNNARELWGLEGMTLEAQLHTAELKIQVVNSGNKENSYRFGRLLIGHFDRVNKFSAYTAKNLLTDKSISLIQNHTHRGGCSFKRAYDRDLVAFENFCLCDRNPAYVDHPDWQLGFSIIHRDGDFFYVEQHPIIESAEGEPLVYKAYFNGACVRN